MRALLTFSAIALASISFALTPGEKAPDVKVAAIVKGSMVDLTKGIHVVEFWATWCGPCKQSIPHLTELAEKYKGKVDFTGVSVYERGENQLERVKKFVDEMGPKMNYNVEFDGEGKFMAANWMEAAKQNGIPTAFLVKDGQILWIGHPMTLDTPIAQVLDGSFDAAGFKAKFEESMALQAKRAEAQKARAALMQPFITAYRAKDYPGALKAMDELELAHPELKATLEPSRFNIFAQQGSPEIVGLATRFATDEFKNSPALLNSLAWSLVDPKTKIEKPNYQAAVILAKQAAEATQMKDPMILDTYALALFKSGDKKGAFDTQNKAVELAKTDKQVDAATAKEMQDRLNMYR